MSAGAVIDISGRLDVYGVVRLRVLCDAERGAWEGTDNFGRLGFGMVCDVEGRDDDGSGVVGLKICALTCMGFGRVFVGGGASVLPKRPFVAEFADGRTSRTFCWETGVLWTVSFPFRACVAS